MKKALTLMLALYCTSMFLAVNSKAQDVTGKTFVNAGIGLGTFNITGTGGLPLNVSVEHGFTDKISAGIYVGYIQRKFATYWKYKYTVVGARGSYHFNELLKIDQPKLDVYGGATLYYRRYVYRYKNNGEEDETLKSSGGDVGIALHAGGRYMFAERVGVFAEIGYGISPLQLGLTVQL